LIIERKYFALFFLGVLFVWAYNGFPTLIALVCIGVFVFYITERKIEFKLILSAGMGIIVGLVANPYFPKNINFLWSHIVPKVFTATYQTAVGSEWYPYDSWVLIKVCGISLIAYLIGIAVTDRKKWLQDKPRLFWFSTASLYLILLFKSRRFIEYFPPTAILFLAFAVRNQIPIIARARDLFHAVLIVLFLLASSALAIERAAEDVRNEPYTYAYKGGSEWLQKNTPPGSIVFHTDWDDFPMLFFFNTHNRYIVGLDPDLMRLENESLFHLWQKITLGQNTDPADLIVRMFNSRYVLTDNRHKDFIRMAEDSNRFKRVFADNYTVVYRIE
jgi:hypothetical protein